MSQNHNVYRSDSIVLIDYTTKISNFIMLVYTNNYNINPNQINAMHCNDFPRPISSLIQVI